MKPPPYAHQTAAFEKGKNRPFFAFFMKYGAGKSRVLIDNAIYLYVREEIDGMLVAAPKGVYLNWSSAELPAHWEDDKPLKVGWYDASGTKDQRDGLGRVMKAGKAFRVMLVNIESVGTANGEEACEQFLTSGRMLMAVDESTTIKNPKAVRTKAAVRLGRLATYTRILTGDPYANSPLDVWAQFQFLKPGALGYPSLIGFRNRFARVAPVPGAPRWVKRVVGFKDLEDLKELVAPHAFFADKPPLPPKVMLPPRQCAMLPKQRQAYDDMRRYSLVEIGRQLDLGLARVPAEEVSFEDLVRADQTEVEKPVPVKTASAEIVLTQMMRMQQIACGFVKTEDGEEVDLCDGKNPRIEETLQVIEELGPQSKVIIWCPFKYSLRELKAALDKEYGPGTVVTYDGSTSTEDREYAKVAFQDRTGPVRFFLGNQQTAGRGITLTAADGVIYFANQFDNELRANSEDRAHRIGLDHSVVYQDIVSAPVDLKVTEALAAKKTISDLLQDGSWKDIFS